MSSESDLPFDFAKADEIFVKLSEWSQGRELVNKMKAQLIHLNQQYRQLSPGDKKQFKDEFKGKFEEAMKQLYKILEVIKNDNQGENGRFKPQEDEQMDYIVFVVAFILVTLLLGWDFVVYLF